VRQVYNGSLANKTLYGLLGLPIGLGWFIVFATALSLAGSLLVILIGFVLLSLTLRIAGGAAHLERRLLYELLRVEVPRANRSRDPDMPKTIGSRIIDPLRDGTYWRELFFVLARFPLGIASFVVAIVSWTYPFWALSTIAWGWWVFGGWTVLILITGAASIVLGPLLIHAMAELHVYLASLLLGPSQAQLVQRARVVEQSRDRSLEAAEAERRRIERNLHDGAQARLATVALDLGRAKRKLEQGGASDEVGRIIDGAHEDAKAAIVELRDLARGIHPAVLTDRGLDAALSEVAARCSVPIHLDVRMQQRPTMPVESAAYFAVCELITNIGRHSSANNAWVTVRGTDDRLSIEVSDDGVGGVATGLGTGISGLYDRLTAVDGTMNLHSPLGGGTTALIELPVT
jgi:signal transduction histidine kinase